jgi:hypothetical protein
MQDEFTLFSSSQVNFFREFENRLLISLLLSSHSSHPLNKDYFQGNQHFENVTNKPFI